ncbi:MAG: DNA-binding response regulator [Deltaproteobacteria bacterium]|nr:MAG: DNA-binding response regulator [Deltaproteobacteria bacterium]
MKRRILLVDDEVDLLEALLYVFRQAGYEVETVTTGRAALERLERGGIDLVIVDLMLPDVTGTQVCLRLRADERTRDLPILVLSARSDEMDRVLGFEVGADDYVTKPFSAREVLLRAEALLRRAGTGGAVAPSKVIRVGALEVDLDAHRTYVGGREVELTALEFRLLTTLMERRGRVQPREVLLRDVWGLASDLATRTVDTHVHRLRAKLGVAAASIQTVRGVGYRFVVPDAPEHANPTS